MSLLSAFLSAVKSEIDWVISSLALAERAAESQPADAPADDGTPSKDADATHSDAKAEAASIVTAHEDGAPHHHAPASLSADQNYLHHIAYHAEDGSETKSALLASAASDQSVPHANVAPVDSMPESFGGSPQPALFEGFGSHAAPFSDGDASVLQFASVNSNAHGHGGGGGTPHPDYTTSGPLQITIHYDSSVGSAPAQFVQDVNYVADFFAAHFHDSASITINVGYGEVAGYNMGASILGESITNLTSVSFMTLIDSLNADTASAVDGRGTLPADTSDPTGGGNWWVSQAEAKALGISVGLNPPVDGSIGLSSFKTIFDYNIGEKPVSGQYDFVSVVAHEMSEVMGRMLFVGENVGGQSNSYDPLDLFHFSGDGTRDFSGSTAGYFSIDGGHTDLHNFNTTASGDFGDWAKGQATDSFDAFGGSGKLAPVTGFDLTVMDAIGWDLVSSATTIP
jgi:hypothetical protein